MVLVELAWPDWERARAPVMRVPAGRGGTVRGPVAEPIVDVGPGTGSYGAVRFGDRGRLLTLFAGTAVWAVPRTRTWHTAVTDAVAPFLFHEPVTDGIF